MGIGETVRDLQVLKLGWKEFAKCSGLDEPLCYRWVHVAVTVVPLTWKQIFPFFFPVDCACGQERQQNMDEKCEGMFLLHTGGRKFLSRANGGLLVSK